MSIYRNVEIEIAEWPAPILHQTSEARRSVPLAPWPGVTVGTTVGGGANLASETATH